MKKQYKKPEMKEVKLKHRANLLGGSPEVGGEVGYNTASEMTRRDA